MFLDLRVIRLPVNALVSILHRVSGVVLVFTLPWWLWVFAESLRSEAGYGEVLALLQGWGGWLAFFGLWALAHHLFAGVRHLAMDAHWGLGKQVSRWTAWVVLLLDGLSVPVLVWVLL